MGEVAYRLSLDLEAGAKSYRAETEIAFTDHGSGDTFVEFSGGEIEEMELNGAPLEPRWRDHRLVLPGEGLRAGENRVRVRYVNPFDHGGEGFHQFIDPEDGSEYLYTQFEPYQAHRLLPCFDQPDLKATFAVTVVAPAAWEVITNTRPVSREDAGEGRHRYDFERSLPFSPYLLAVVAGPYQGVETSHGDLPLRLLCRRSMVEHLDADEIFEITAAGLDFYEDFFAHPYPFTKYDQIFVPEFNWGGMENVGAVTYTDAYLFRDPPILTERLRRTEVLLHELAHMWFGDLVTMRWWDDLWLNESFASYMAYLATEEATELPGSWQDFHTRMKVWAYHQDELVTTHQIADRVTNTDETFLNFDGITYGKGAAVLKQLVAAIGPDRFREGMRRYFQRHAFSNATLADFLAALQEGGGLDLEAWARSWLESRSVNTLRASWDVADGELIRLRLRQEAPAEHPGLRPHVAEVALVSGGKVDSLPAAISDEEAEVVVAGRSAPRLVFPNHGDHAYAKVILDARSAAAIAEELRQIEDPLLRQLLWTSGWLMVRDRLMPSPGFLEMVCRLLPDEDDPLVVAMVTGVAAGGSLSRSIVPPMLDFYVPESRRPQAARAFVQAGWRVIEGAGRDVARSWARAVVAQVEAEEDLRRAGELVDGPDERSLVDQDLRWEVAVRWVAHGLEEADERLARERDRDPSDRGDRAIARAEAARPDPGLKQRIWDRIQTLDYPSLHLARSAMSGFNWPHQRVLLEPFVDPFFKGLPEVFSEWEREAAKQYFSRMFPWYRVDGELVARTRQVLERVDEEEAMLRRMLREAVDEAERAVACRSYAS